MERITTISEQGHSAQRLSLNRNDLARIAYAAVEDMAFLEMNDGNRLGYHLYLFLIGDIPSIAEAIYEAKARIQLHPKELERILSERLAAAGVS